MISTGISSWINNPFAAKGDWPLHYGGDSPESTALTGSARKSGTVPKDKCGRMRTLMRTLIWLTRPSPPEDRGAELPDFTGHFGRRSRRLRTLRPLDRLFFMFSIICTPIPIPLRASALLGGQVEQIEHLREHLADWVANVNFPQSQAFLVLCERIERLNAYLQLSLLFFSRLSSFVALRKMRPHRTG